MESDNLESVNLGEGGNDKKRAFSVQRSAFSVQMTEEEWRRDSSLLGVAQNDSGSVQKYVALRVILREQSDRRIRVGKGEGSVQRSAFR